MTPYCWWMAERFYQSIKDDDIRQVCLIGKPKSPERCERIYGIYPKDAFDLATEMLKLPTKEVKAIWINVSVHSLFEDAYEIWYEY